MSKIENLQNWLRAHKAERSALERLSAQKPDDWGLELLLTANKTAESDLQSEIQEQLMWVGEEICDYKLTTQKASGPTLADFTSTLSEFQKLYSMVLESNAKNAFKTDPLALNPKKTTRLSADFVERSAFGVAYTYTGSLGVVLTLKVQDNLLDGELFDSSIKELMAMAQCVNPDQIRVFADKIGPAAVRCLYRWATAHLKSNVTPQIKWREDLINIEISKERLEVLKSSIEEVSDESIEIIELVGDLTGALVKTKTFTFDPESGSGQIQGAVRMELNADHTVELPKKYRARVEIKTKTNYATDKDIKRYSLLGLTPV